MGSLTRDGTAEPVSRDQILRHERERGNVHFSCSADHVQDWHRLIHTLAIFATIHTYILGIRFNISISTYFFIFYSNFTTTSEVLYFVLLFFVFSFSLLLKRGTMNK